MKLEKQVSHSPKDLDLLLSQFNLALYRGKFSVPKHGRIATNLMVDTSDGQIFIRSYPDTYPRERIEMEVSALDHLAKHGVSVPILLRTKDGQLIVRGDDRSTTFIYRPLEGQTLSQDDLSPYWAMQAGELLALFIRAAEKFAKPKISVDGDIEYIGILLSSLEKAKPELANENTLKAMKKVLADPLLNNDLQETPSGLVHADFFFENVLHQQGTLIGILDLGDSYYGKILNDIVIGAMEFSVDTKGKWYRENLEAFVTPLRPWLVKHKVTADLCLKLLCANCVRFAVYTMPYTVEEGGRFGDNQYVQRFAELEEDSLKRIILETFYTNID